MACVFGLDFVAYYLLFSIVFKVQVSSGQSGCIYTLVFDIPVTATLDARTGVFGLDFIGYDIFSSIIIFKVQVSLLVLYFILPSYIIVWRSYSLQAVPGNVAYSKFSSVKRGFVFSCEDNRARVLCVLCVLCVLGWGGVG